MDLIFQSNITFYKINQTSDEIRIYFECPSLLSEMQGMGVQWMCRTDGNRLIVQLHVGAVPALYTWCGCMAIAINSNTRYSVQHLPPSRSLCSAVPQGHAVSMVMARRWAPLSWWPWFIMARSSEISPQFCVGRSLQWGQDLQTIVTEPRRHDERVR